MKNARMMISLLIVAAVLAGAAIVRGEEGSAGDSAGDSAAGRYAGEFTVVELDPSSPAPLRLAVQACAGLTNRKLGGSIYILRDDNDSQWLDELGLEPGGRITATGFLDTCLAEFTDCVRYSYDEQQELLPAVLTAAAALGAVPLDTGMKAACADVALDATREFKDLNTPYLATEYVFENYIEATTGLAMLNPGYEINAEDLSDPDLTRDMPSSLVDFVFSQKLFVTFLINGCIDSHPEKRLLSDIVNAGHWPTPVGVFGYNNSWLRGGYIYEAQTRCLDSRNMGAIPTKTGNLSFFSTRRPPITDADELQRNEPEDIEYDPEKTYVAFVVGDGDNVRFIMTSRKKWLRQRLADCEKADNSCAPLTWSISPHLARISPDVLEWYYASSSSTGKDYFTLPPSGHLYAYPTSLNKKDQRRFVLATERDARILGVRGVVHWDWFDTWRRAEKYFLPLYARDTGFIRGVFPVNVPYMFPTFPWWPADSFYKVLEGKDGSRVVVFRPREWRGVDGKAHRGGDEPFFLTPKDMAAEIGSYPPGTVTWVYMTSDGGLSLENSFMELVGLLPPHVRLVSADTAARLALDASR